MTVNMGEGPTDSGQGNVQDQVVNSGSAPVVNEPSINPAWNPLLEQLPSSLHGMVTPHLSEWDKNVQQMVQKVHSEYAPWKPFQEAKLDPEALYQSYQIQQALEADPQKFIEAVMEHYGIQFEQGQQPEENGVEEEPGLFDITQNPEFQRVTGMTEQMAQLLLQKHQAEEDAVMDQQLDSDIAAAKQKHGEFDEDWVLQRVMYFGEDVDTAAQNYQAHVQQIISQHRNPGANAPVIMGSGGGTPSTASPVANLSPQDRRSLIAQRLQAAAAQGD
jgi:hypothetical protein